MKSPDQKAISEEVASSQPISITLELKKELLCDLQFLSAIGADNEVKSIQDIITTALEWYCAHAPKEIEKTYADEQEWVRELLQSG